MTNQRDRAASFRQMHHENLPLVLPNAWDAASARVIELAGAKAIATSSAGVSWVYGRRDGEKVQREEMIQMVRYIVQAVGVPVTADVESGYGNGSPQDVAETVQAVITAGAWMVMARVAIESGVGAISSPGQVRETSSSVAPQRRNQGRSARASVARVAAPAATPSVFSSFFSMGIASGRRMAEKGKDGTGPEGGIRNAEG